MLRAILFYGRSSVIPEVNYQDPVAAGFMNNPNFAFDAVFLHEKSSPENKIQVENWFFLSLLCPADASTLSPLQDVYNKIVEVESGGGLQSYFFETTKSTKV